jgi:small subunit ribosomal protein S4
VSGKPVNIPSYLVKTGDEIRVRDGSRKVEKILESMETVARRGVPQWLELDKDNFRGAVKMLPTREELTMPVQEQLVVELYSK